jgi:hypothetical protein
MAFALMISIVAFWGENQVLNKLRVAIERSNAG